MFSDGHSYSNSAVFLTAAHPRLTNGPDILAGPSLDQIVAARIAGDTRLPSLQLCIENLNSLAGDCGHGYSCAYANTISWASPTEPLPMERHHEPCSSDYSQILREEDLHGHRLAAVFLTGSMRKPVI